MLPYSCVLFAHQIILVKALKIEKNAEMISLTTSIRSF